MEEESFRRLSKYSAAFDPFFNELYMRRNTAFLRNRYPLRVAVTVGAVTRIPCGDSRKKSRMER
jgi:enamine deaminase RidA (YjgF/YER057c/UK114 family)